MYTQFMFNKWHVYLFLSGLTSIKAETRLNFEHKKYFLKYYQNLENLAQVCRSLVESFEGPVRDLE